MSILFCFRAESGWGPCCPAHRPSPLCRTFASRRKPRYWRYSMNCTGTETHISSCKLGPHVSRDPVKNITCENGQPAVVSCVPGQVFSPDGPSRFRKAYKPEVSMGRRCGHLAPGRGSGWSGSSRSSQERVRRAGLSREHCCGCLAGDKSPLYGG